MASGIPKWGKMGVQREKLYSFLVESKTFRKLYWATWRTLFDGWFSLVK